MEVAGFLWQAGGALSLSIESSEYPVMEYIANVLVRV